MSHIFTSHVPHHRGWRSSPPKCRKWGARRPWRSSAALPTTLFSRPWRFWIFFYFFFKFFVFFFFFTLHAGCALPHCTLRCALFECRVGSSFSPGVLCVRQSCVDGKCNDKSNGLKREKELPTQPSMGWLRLVGSFKLYISLIISSLLQGSLAKDTYNLKKPTNRDHPIGSSFSHLNLLTLSLTQLCRTHSTLLRLCRLWTIFLFFLLLFNVVFVYFPRFLHALCSAIQPYWRHDF